MGSMHRNTYLDSPKLLSADLSLKKDPQVLIAGQMAGVEGYVESAAMGIWAGLVVAARLDGRSASIPPPETAIGSLLHAVTTVPLHGAFSPMNINFGLFPPLVDNKGGKEARRRRTAERAHQFFEMWRGELRRVSLPAGFRPHEESRT